MASVPSIKGPNALLKFYVSKYMEKYDEKPVLAWAKATVMFRHVLRYVGDDYNEAQEIITFVFEKWDKIRVTCKIPDTRPLIGTVASSYWFAKFHSLYRDGGQLVGISIKDRVAVTSSDKEIGWGE